MTLRRGNNRNFCLGAMVVLLAAGVLVNSSPAASISYGNFGPVAPGVTFQNVTESSATDPVPLFNSPTPFVTGLDFNPTSFVSFASGSADITNGELNFTAAGNVALPNLVAINSISISEAGDFTLVGNGTSATQVQAGAILRATVTQINGVNVAPIVLTPVNASVGFNLAANPGSVQPWSIGVTLNVAAQLGANQKATKVDVAIGNQLLSIGETANIASISKREFIVNVDAEGVIPEPSALLLLLGAVLTCGVTTRRVR